MSKEIYRKREGKYLGDDMSRPSFNSLKGYNYLWDRVNKALKENNLSEENASLVEMSNYIEDNNCRLDYLQFTLDEMFIVLAIFDMLMGKRVIDWAKEGKLN